MKVLAFTDTHASNVAYKDIKKLVKAEKVDYILCCGDFTIFGEDMQGWINKLDKLGKKVFLIHGNHEIAEEVKELCEPKKNLEFIHKKKVNIDKDYVIMGYGGDGFSRKDKQLDEWGKKTLAEIPKNKKIILMTHAPPYKTELDLMYEGHVGSQSVAKLIKRAKPVLFLAGHIHENNGVDDILGKVFISNPGPWGKVYDI